MMPPANAVTVAAAIAAAHILEVRYCLEVCGLNRQMTKAIILEGYSKTTDFSMMLSKRMDSIVYLLGKMTRFQEEFVHPSFSTCRKTIMARSILSSMSGFMNF
jgi:hypothetical protein